MSDSLYYRKMHIKISHHIILMPRVKLADKYQTEREEICKKLIDIVGTEFYLCDLDADTEKQQAILALKDEIPKYFAVSALAPYKKTIDVKRDYLIMVRGVLRLQGYNVTSSSAGKLVDDKIIGTTKYFIFRNNS
jgi:hypothetical protein